MLLPDYRPGSEGIRQGKILRSTKEWFILSKFTVIKLLFIEQVIVNQFAKILTNHELLRNHNSD